MTLNQADQQAQHITNELFGPYNPDTQDHNLSASHIDMALNSCPVKSLLWTQQNRDSSL